MAFAAAYPIWTGRVQMTVVDESEEVDRHVLKRYEVGQKLGKGVRASKLFAI